MTSGPRQSGDLAGREVIEARDSGRGSWVESWRIACTQAPTAKPLRVRLREEAVVVEPVRVHEVDLALELGDDFRAELHDRFLLRHGREVEIPAGLVTEQAHEVDRVVDFLARGFHQVGAVPAALHPEHGIGFGLEAERLHAVELRLIRNHVVGRVHEANGDLQPAGHQFPARPVLRVLRGVAHALDARLGRAPAGSRSP